MMNMKGTKPVSALNPSSLSQSLEGTDEKVIKLGGDKVLKVYWLYIKRFLASEFRKNLGAKGFLFFPF